MLNWGGYVALLTWTVRQAREDTSIRPSHVNGIETDEAAARVRRDAADFLASVQAAYLDIRDEAGAVLEVIATRRMASPLEPEPEGEETGAIMSRCSRCGERKESIEFYRIASHGRKRPDYWCASCRRLYKKKSHGHTRG